MAAVYPAGPEPMITRFSTPLPTSEGGGEAGASSSTTGAAAVACRGLEAREQEAAGRGRQEGKETRRLREEEEEEEEEGGADERAAATARRVTAIASAGRERGRLGGVGRCCWAGVAPGWCRGGWVGIGGASGWVARQEPDDEISSE